MDRPDRYELLRLRVNPTTKEQYDRGLSTFLDYLEKTGNKGFDNLRLVEGFLMDIAVHTYHSQDKSCWQTVVNAMLGVELYFPQLRGSSNDLRASLEGWTKQVPPTPRDVISELVAVGLAVELFVAFITVSHLLIPITLDNS